MCRKLFGAGTLYFSFLVINEHQHRHEQDFPLHASAELLIWNSNVLESRSDHEQDHVYFDYPESNCPVHHWKFY